MDALQAASLQAYWPVMLSTIVFIGWCARLESKVLYLEKDRNEVRDERDDLRKETTARETVLWGKLDTLQSTVTELVRTVAKLEGKLENHRDH